MTTRTGSIVACAAMGAVLAAAPAAAQEPLVREGASVAVSDHVWVIPDESLPLVPNVGIVVGQRATLVVDTGLGPRNGATILREVRTISSNDELFVVTTHYHPEHSLGMAGLGPEAKLVMPRVQQDEMRSDGAAIRDRFAQRSALTADLLRDVEYPTAARLFDRETTVDLGGVRARVFTMGPMHTRGDTLIYVEGDNVLFTGDVAMRAFPAFASPSSSARTWVANLEQLQAMAPRVVVPSHGPMGDATMIADYHEYLTELRARVAELKRQGRGIDDIVALVGPEFDRKFPGRGGPGRVGGAARSIYAELP